jgi:hypothetical protein
MIILVPILVPLLTTLQVDLVHFGIILLVNLVVRRRRLVPSPWLGEPHGRRRGRLAGGYLLSASDH